MDQTPNLQLPYILPAQAQKHVTHNEAIRALDALVQLSVLDTRLAAPPAIPADGARYIVAASPSGVWAGQTGKIAAFQDGAWMFYVPHGGWIAYSVADAKAYVFDGAAWVPLSAATSINPAALVGVNAVADAVNKLSVNSDASLFNHYGHGHQLKINKATPADTASVLLQDGFSGRAEIGLTGDDNIHVKVSADGSAWKEALKIDATSGNVGVGGVTAPSTTLHVNGPMRCGSYTVATLPTASAALKSAHAFVTDAVAPTFLGALTGGGTVVCPVFCNGTAWLAG